MSTWSNEGCIKSYGNDREKCKRWAARWLRWNSHPPHLHMRLRWYCNMIRCYTRSAGPPYMLQWQQESLLVLCYACVSATLSYGISILIRSQAGVLMASSSDTCPRIPCSKPRAWKYLQHSQCYYCAVLRKKLIIIIQLMPKMRVYFFTLDSASSTPGVTSL